MRKLYAYVDETGQETEGDFFLVDGDLDDGTPETGRGVAALELGHQLGANSPRSH